MRIAAILLTTLLLAACGEMGGKPEAAPPGSEPQPEPPPGPVGPPVAQTLSPPAFAGAWASSAANCDQYAWTVTESEIDTPGEVFCRWAPTDLRADGENRWTVTASCSAEAETAPAELTFVGGQQSLTIEGAPFDPIPLVRCSQPAQN